MTIAIPPDRPEWDRITDMRYADGTPFDMDTVYWLAANNHTTGSRFLASGSSYPGGGRLQALDDSQKLLAEDGSLRYEEDYNNYGTYEPGMPIVRTFTAQEILTLDGKDPINNGEGCTGLVADYILRKLDGKLTNEFTPNWCFDTTDTPSGDWVLYNKAIEVVNADIGINYNGTGETGASPANIRSKLASADVQALWDLYAANIEKLLDGREAYGATPGCWAAFEGAMKLAGEVITDSGTIASPVESEVARAATALELLDAAIRILAMRKPMVMGIQMVA